MYFFNVKSSEKVYKIVTKTYFLYYNKMQSIDIKK